MLWYACACFALVIGEQNIYFLPGKKVIQFNCSICIKFKRQYLALRTKIGVYQNKGKSSGADTNVKNYLSSGPHAVYNCGVQFWKRNIIVVFFVLLF